jgi:hypothetical protein
MSRNSSAKPTISVSFVMAVYLSVRLVSKVVLVGLYYTLLPIDCQSQTRVALAGMGGVCSTYNLVDVLHMTRMPRSIGRNLRTLLCQSRLHMWDTHL